MTNIYNIIKQIETKVDYKKCMNKYLYYQISNSDLVIKGYNCIE